MILELLLSAFISQASAQNPQCPTRPFGDSSNACASTAFVQGAVGGSITCAQLPALTGSVTSAGGTCTTAIASGVVTFANMASGVIRDRFSGNRDYYVRRDGNDSNTGTANTAGGAWLTIQRSLSVLCTLVDFNGFNVVVHVQGANVGDGTYVENLLTCAYEGYIGNGFGQFIVQAENGVATINGITATATILAAIGGNASPIQFKSFAVGNANASGILIECDDGGFLALNGLTFNSTGAGGIVALSTQSAGRCLFMNSTFTFAAGMSTGSGFKTGSNGAIIFQPGTTINFAGASTFSNAVVDVGPFTYVDNTSTTWSGTTPTGKAFVYDARGLLINQGLIPGTIAGTITPIPVGLGGTGLISGTSGGVPYFNSATTIASSSVLGANGIMIGAGAGGAPAASSVCNINGASGTVFQCTSSANSSPTFNFVNSAADASSALMLYDKNRSGGNSLSGDTIIFLVGRGFANASNQNAVAFKATQTAASSGSNIPTNVILQTSNTAGLLNQTWTFNQDGHDSVTQSAAIVVSGCGGTTTAVANSTDRMGAVIQQSNNGCVVTFGKAFTSWNFCVVDAAAVLPIFSPTYSLTAITVVTSAASTPTITWHCEGV